jgi:O-6-methylguanine DNA methyltransferase
MSSDRRGLQAAVLKTTWGDITICASGRGVVQCTLPVTPARSAPLQVRSVHLSPGAPAVLRRAVAYAHAMLSGRPPGRCPALDESARVAATPFQRGIWKALRGIPRGRTATYAGLARQAGCPGAARAAGSACGANPLPLFIPCHRAVAARGGLGGFSAGLAWKTRLLAGEGAWP